MTFLFNGNDQDRQHASGTISAAQGERSRSPKALLTRRDRRRDRRANRAI